MSISPNSCMIVISILKNIKACLTHIFRDGNDVANKLANFDVSTSSFIWWSKPKVLPLLLKTHVIYLYIDSSGN